MPLFPSGPANGATANVNGYQFTFDSTANAWNRTQSFTGNLAVTTIIASGNITGGNLLGALANGNSNVNIPAANGNVNISAVGTANVVVVTGTGANIAGTLNATGNANTGNIGAAQGIFTTSANIPLINSGTSNITLTSGANVSTFIGGNATAQLVVTATGANIPGTLNVTGNTTFSGTGQRIFADFSNGNISNRTFVQDSTSANATNFYVIPGATNSGNSATVGVFNNGADPANTSFFSMSMNASFAIMQSSFAGTGTGKPILIRTGGSDRIRIDNAGTVNILGPSGAGSANVASLISAGNINNNPNTTSNVWKQAALVASGGYGGGIALINTGDNSNGYFMYSTGTPCQLNIQFGANAGNTGSAGVALTSTATSWSAFSDERLKTDLQPIANAIQKSSTLRTVTGRYKTDPEGTVRSFLIAQDVLPVVPSAVSTNEDGMLLLSRDELIPLLFATVNELSAQVAELKTEVNNLKNP